MKTLAILKFALKPLSRELGFRQYAFLPFDSRPNKLLPYITIYILQILNFLLSLAVFFLQFCKHVRPVPLDEGAKFYMNSIHTGF